MAGGRYVQFETLCLAAREQAVTIEFEQPSSVRVTLLAVKGYVVYAIGSASYPFDPTPIEELTTAQRGGINSFLPEGKQTTVHILRTDEFVQTYSLQVASGSKEQDAIVSVITEIT